MAMLPKNDKPKQETLSSIWVVRCLDGKYSVQSVPVKELVDGDKRHYQEHLAGIRGRTHEAKDRGITWDTSKLRAIDIAKNDIQANLKQLRDGMTKASKQSKQMWTVARGTGGVFVKVARTGGTNNEQKVYEMAIAEVQQNLSDLHKGEYTALSEHKNAMSNKRSLGKK